MIIKRSCEANLLKKLATAGHRRTEEKRKRKISSFSVSSVFSVAKK
jgi:hypothetical protein